MNHHLREGRASIWRFVKMKGVNSQSHHHGVQIILLEEFNYVCHTWILNKCSSASQPCWRKRWTLNVDHCPVFWLRPEILKRWEVVVSIRTGRGMLWTGICWTWRRFRPDRCDYHTFQPAFPFGLIFTVVIISLILFERWEADVPFSPIMSLLALFSCFLCVFSLKRCRTRHEGTTDNKISVCDEDLLPLSCPSFLCVLTLFLSPCVFQAVCYIN